MEIHRLLKIDEEALFLEEDIPLVRTASFSRMAYLVEEVPVPSTAVSGVGVGRIMEEEEEQEEYYLGRKKREISIAASSSKSPPLLLEQEDHSSSSSSWGMVDGFTDALPIIPQIRGVKKNELLTAVVVSRWDNIVGPQCVYLWTEEMTSVFYPTGFPPELVGVIKYVTDHTVDHQDVDGNILTSSTQRTNLCIVTELNLVYMSISIRVPAEMDTVLEFASSSSMTANDPDQPVTSVPHAITISADLKYLSHFLLLRPLLNSWLNEFAPKIGILVCQDKMQSSMINSWCAELCKTITALQMCWGSGGPLPDYQSQNSNSNSPSSQSKDGRKDKDSPRNGTTIKPEKEQSYDMVEYLPPDLQYVTTSVWSSLLTAHLSTFGSSIIVGFDNVAVNQIIRFLLCFSTHQEGYCSRYSLPNLPDTFMKGLLIQGLALGKIGERSISYNQVTSSRLPMTHIELSTKLKVKHMNPHTHVRSKSKILMQELRALWTSNPFISPQDEPYPELVKDAARFVTKFIEDLAALPSKRRYGRLLLFRRQLHAQAMTLITFLHSIKHYPKPERDSFIKQLPLILNLDAQEYTLVQVTAEKLKPGTMRLLFHP